MTGATYSVTRCSFGLCLRLLLREPCGILAEPKQNSTPPDILYYARLDSILEKRGSCLELGNRTFVIRFMKSMDSFWARSRTHTCMHACMHACIHTYIRNGTTCGFSCGILAEHREKQPPLQTYRYERNTQMKYKVLLTPVMYVYVPGLPQKC